MITFDDISAAMARINRFDEAESYAGFMEAHGIDRDELDAVAADGYASLYLLGAPLDEIILDMFTGGFILGFELGRASVQADDAEPKRADDIVAGYNSEGAYEGPEDADALATARAAAEDESPGQYMGRTLGFEEPEDGEQ